jgi:hypothetical protein
VVYKLLYIYQMTCNTDLLHVGIYIMAAGFSMLISSALNFTLLTPVANEAALQEQNDIQKAATQILIQNKVSNRMGRLDFGV